MLESADVRTLRSIISARSVATCISVVLLDILEESILDERALIVAFEPMKEVTTVHLGGVDAYDEACERSAEPWWSEGFISRRRVGR
jgi:hypothetical protein